MLTKVKLLTVSLEMAELWQLLLNKKRPVCLSNSRIVKLQTNVCIRMSTNFHLVHSNKIRLISNTHNIQLNELSQCGVWKIWMRRFGEEEKWENWVELAGWPTLTQNKLFQSCYQVWVQSFSLCATQVISGEGCYLICKKCAIFALLCNKWQMLTRILPPPSST